MMFILLQLKYRMDHSDRLSKYVDTNTVVEIGKKTCQLNRFADACFTDTMVFLFKQFLIFKEKA